MNRPKVSVSLITYNQEKYIAACLDSIISQVVDFDLEIVVADDCSADSTPVIIEDYARRHPEIIKAVLRKSNLGMVKNAFATIATCTGQYIALMEGDDVWIDNNKLQLQANFLDKNPDCVFCFTNGYTFHEREHRRDVIIPEKYKLPEKFDLDFFIETNFIIPNNTKMFRREILPEVPPDWIYGSINWDWVLHILQASKGKIGYINRITLDYRRHTDAAFVAQKEVDIMLNSIYTITELDKYLDYKYNRIFKNLSWEYHELSLAYLAEKKFFHFLIYYAKYVATSPQLLKVNAKDELWRIKNALLSRTN